MPRPMRAIVRHDLLILRRDPVFLLVFTLMPLVVMAFMKPAVRASLVLAGNRNANGAEQAVPGMAVMFAFFLVGNVGFAVFREHGWATWDRLRASSATDFEIMAGKTVVPLLTLALQQVVLFVVGGFVYRLHVGGSVVAIFLVESAMALCLVSLGLVLLALCRTVLQLNAISNVGAMIFAGLGGALTSLSTLPGWARSVAPVSPGYWAMRGMRSVILDGGGVSSVGLPVAVLLGYAVVLGAIAARRFHMDETKVSWA